jgi:hypothetical protein
MFAAVNRKIDKMFKKGKTTTFKTILSPVAQIIPKVFEKMNPDFRYRKFFLLDHLFSLVLFNLSEDLDSMRATVNYIQDCPWISKTIKLAEVSKSSFSDANNHRNYQAFEEIFSLLYQFAARLLPGGVPLTENVKIMDGTMIRCVASMVWAKYKTKSNAIKGHLLFDLAKGLPEAINITDGLGSERSILKSYIKKGLTYIVDRGYNCYRLYDHIITLGAYFVGRLFSDAAYEIVERFNVPKVDNKQGVISDQKIRLGSHSNKMKHETRLIIYKAFDGKLYMFITNRFDLSALEVCELYRLRWEIETFFKWLKGHLKVKKFIVRSLNGVLIQIYSALITYLLLKIYAWKMYNTTINKRTMIKIKANLFAGVNRTQYLELIEFLCTYKT